MSEMQGDVFGLRATFMEVTEFVRRGSACLTSWLSFLGTLGLLRVHGLLADWLGSERVLAWLNSEMTEKPLRSPDEEGVQAL